MDIEQFVKTQNSALKRYRRIYILLDFAAISFILYTLFFIFNMEGVFSMVSTFELHIGSTYQLMDYSIPFETLGLAVAAVIFSLIIIIILHIRDKRSNVLNLVENKYPVLFERLRTAYDNRKNSNIIVDNLLTNVMVDTKTVRSSSFLNKKRLAFGIFALLATSSFFTYVTISDYRTDITPEDISKIIEELPLIKEEETQPEGLLPEGGDDGEGDESGTENLFGEPAIIVIEGEEIDLTLPPGAGIGFTIKDEGEIRTEDFERSSAYDISIISSQAYYESLPEGYDNIIKAYFEEMAQ
ncbi:MAG: hypothetical protein P1P69_04290 [Methanosarcinaceae archaeon]|nr:hypothetical protein [Methanosarcinaceae archaeon]MDF1533706.1 hypothetical protein [Methanosarcinaceae archaeon]